jgi:two-component system, OmpR family, phosphate regulon response regulator PhoB
MKKILIVDDSKEVRQLVITTLDLQNYTVFEALNGVNAVELARKHNPDLIIMDIVMPGVIDGVEAIRQIKGSPDTAHCNIIILSGSGTDRRKECFAAGATDIITKPFSPLDLISKVEQILETTL